MALMMAAMVAGPARAQAQGAAGGQPPSARVSAPIDLTGYWVSFVTEDWLYRMVTPPKGVYGNVPVTREALGILNAWNPAADQAAGEACKSYGAAAIMRVPGRFHVTWQDDNILRLDSDAGMQTRLFRFTAAPVGRTERTWQGTSAARWETGRAGGLLSGAPVTRSGSLTVVTTNMRAGYLRKNGVPYSQNATLTEYFDVAPHPGGGQLLVVTSVVVDPQYLEQPFIVSSHFKKEADGSRWDPTPCSATW
jgi:hypothetical protein